MTDQTRLLLIDDDQVDRTFVRRALATSGIEFDLVEAASGEIGLEVAGRQPFDCVLLDYRLPDIDAFDVLGALLASPSNNHTVIILTGESDPDIAFRLMRAGALDYLAKSELTPSSLSRAIRYARARREFLAETESARRVAEEKTRELQTLNDQKNLLFSIIAHDLRNPFQALLGMSELQKRAAERKDMSKLVHYAAGINQSASRAAALMEGLFSWATLQLNTTDITATRVDLDTLIAEIAEGVSEALERKQLSLRTECDSSIVFADRDMLAAVLRNLVANAVKFSNAGGTIVVSARRNSDQVGIAVSDDGIGMSDEVLGDLFRVGRRTTTPGTRGEPGSGLGLLICHSLVERLGGTLSVESRVGEGSTFRFVLPTCPPDIAEAT